MSSLYFDEILESNEPDDLDPTSPEYLEFMPDGLEVSAARLHCPQCEAKLTVRSEWPMPMDDPDDGFYGFTIAYAQSMGWYDLGGDGHFSCPRHHERSPEPLDGRWREDGWVAAG